MQKSYALSWPLLLSIILMGLSACHSSSSGNASDSSGAAATKNVEAIHLPEFREHPKKEPVAEYRVSTDSKLNKDWAFSVRLYETNKTMAYRVTMKYEELEGDDTLKLPDLGKPPRPVICQGPEKYSCILGFLDNDSTFREYKLVSAKGDQLSIKALKHYAVTQGYRLVSQDMK